MKRSTANELGYRFNRFYNTGAKTNKFTLFSWQKKFSYVSDQGVTNLLTKSSTPVHQCLLLNKELRGGNVQEISDYLRRTGQRRAFLQLLITLASLELLEF